MSTKAKRNRAAEELAFNTAASGVTKNIQQPIPLNGTTMAPSDVVATIAAPIQADRHLDAARVAVASKKAARDAALRLARALMLALKKWVEAAYGADSPVLAEFGFATTAKVQPTADAKAAAVAKRAATRAARHTLGKRQKAKIKGTSSTGANGPTPTKS